LTYYQQMQHPLWQKKRLEVMESAGFECQDCGAQEDQLNVHHPVYKRGAMIWDYEIEELECLCDKCHKSAHDLDERIKKSLSMLTGSDKHRALGYIEALDEFKKLVPDSYEYAQGVSDYIIPQVFFATNNNYLYDQLTHYITDNTGEDIINLITILNDRRSSAEVQ
jgi:hypothetical protein